VRCAALLMVALAGSLSADVEKQTGPVAKEIGLSQKAPQSDREQQIADLNARAVERGKAGDYEGAAAALEQARRLSAPPAAVRSGLYAQVLANLAETYEELSQWERAVALLRDAAAEDERAFGPADLRTARISVRLGSALVVTGRIDEARPPLERAVSVLRADQAAPRFELARALAAIALLNLNLNRPADAEQPAQEAVRLAAAENVENPDYASMLGLLGAVYVVEGNGARALPLLTRSIDMVERTLSPRHPRIAPMLIERGLVEASDRRFALAEQDMRRAIDLLERSGHGTNGDWARYRLARIYMDQRKLAEADEILPAAVERQRNLAGVNPQLPYFIRQLAELRQLQKRYDEAGALYREAIALVRQTSSPAGADQRETASLNDNRPTREKDVRRLAQRASEIFGDRSAQ